MNVKKGDIVKCVDPGRHSVIKEGHIYRVRSVMRAGEQYVTLVDVFMEGEKTSPALFASRFILAPNGIERAIGVLKGNYGGDDR